MKAENSKLISEFKKFHKNAVLKDQERMSKNQEVIDKLRTGYQTQSIMKDLGENGKSNMFSEASRRTIKELGHMELCGKDFRNSSMPGVLETCTRRNILLHMLCMPYALAGREKKD